ncbi:hypothetical protein [Streptomyces sp. NPDC057966]|uniref:hypothetical protein n=1 Tax=Streptomyces sp. NPDC057966 TaxID=3346292 RepID=UPI0036EE9869
MRANEIVERTEAQADLIDAASLISNVTEAVERGVAAPDQPYVRSVLQQLSHLIRACADQTPDPTSAAALTSEAARLRDAAQRLSANSLSPLTHTTEGSAVDRLTEILTSADRRKAELEEMHADYEEIDAREYEEFNAEMDARDAERHQP